MNHHIELQRVKAKYGNSASTETRACLSEMLVIFGDYAEAVLHIMEKIQTLPVHPGQSPA